MQERPRRLAPGRQHLPYGGRSFCGRRCPARCRRTASASAFLLPKLRPPLSAASYQGNEAKVPHRAPRPQSSPVTCSQECVSCTCCFVSHQDPVSKRQDRGGERDSDLMSQKFKGQAALRIKADPDKPVKAPLTWQQGRPFTGDQVGVHRAEQETGSSLSPPLHSSLPSLRHSVSPKTSSYSLSPLPAFSSSFLCPPPTSCFSSSLHPLRSSLCPLPPVSPAGTRKGRVCCGVCGKSFYDKGQKDMFYL